MPEAPLRPERGTPIPRGLRRAAKTLLLRADGGGRLGTGHVMRSLALGEEWAGVDEEAHLVTASLTPALAERARAQGVQVTRLEAEAGSPADARQTITLAQKLASRWVVVDGYQFGAEYQEALVEAGRKVLFFDDYGHAGRYAADLVLNQNLGADAVLYAQREPETRLLLGPRYAILRSEFRRRDESRPTPRVATRLLITLGGSDPDNVTGQVVAALELVTTPDLEAVVVIGGSNPHEESLTRQCAAARRPIRLERNTPRLAELMSWADVAVAAGGTTAWELAFMGVPTLLLVLARNQVELAAHAAAAGLARNLGPAATVSVETIAAEIERLLADPAGRAAMSQRARELVDGRGALRVVRWLRADEIRLRDAVSMADSRLIWEWANDPLSRAVSFSSAEIPWADHQTWFAVRRGSPSCRLWLAESATEDEPLGLVRFELEGNRAIISINVAPDQRGRGWGTRLIWSGCQRLFAETDVEWVDAFIKPDNAASLRAFVQADFEPAGQTPMPGSDALCLRLPRSSV